MGQGGDAIVGSSSRWTREVLQSLLDDLRGAGHSEAAGRIEAVSRWVEAGLRGESLEAAAGSMRPPSAYRETLRSIRAALLAAAPPSDQRAAEGVLAALRVIESLDVALRPKPGQGLSAFESHPEPMQVLVEVAHDLRSPLTAILFLSETLRSGQSGEVNDLQAYQLGLIYSGAVATIDLANNLMQLGREDEFLGGEQPIPFSLRTTLGAVQGMVALVAETKGIDLDVSLPAQDHFVGRPQTLGRVILNLTTNALKFTDAGRVSIEIEELREGRVRFSVQDSGRGIDPSTVARLFDPIGRSTRAGGHFFSESGLGLGIARNLVRQMDSEITWVSERGEGTRFSFELDLPRVGP